MASARQLRSGSYRVQAKKTIDGKKIVKSFTVSPKEYPGCSKKEAAKKAKAKAELLAREWVLSKESSLSGEIRVKEALEQYIADRSNVISPATLREYKNTIKHFESINSIYISDIDAQKIQRLINDMSIDVKKKTIRNRISLLLSALDYAKIDTKFRLKYPQNDSKKVESPDIEDVQMYIKNAPDYMIPIIYLAAFGSLRRGEIIGLKEKNISRDMNTVTIEGNVVKSQEGWIYKMPKTERSIRTIQLPKFVIDSLPKKEDPEDFIFDIKPGTITDRFADISRSLKLPYTFHSLRHFAASFRTDLKIPKKYVQEVGGWTDGNSSVFEKVYNNNLSSSRKKYTQIANKFIEENFKEVKSS